MKKNNNIIIAIDGHSSTGKSTVAKQLAKTLGYTFVDTGAMYRAVTWFALQKNCITDQLLIPKLVELLPKVEIRFLPNSTSGTAEIYVNGVNVENEIRSLHVSQWVSPVATIPQVRRKLVEQQQQMGQEKGLVMDGRDIGTVVFPDAELKLFMTASAEVRAKRRYEEMIQKGEHVTFEEVLSNVKNRDYLDSTRKDSPLKQADDAILIDNSDFTREEQFNYILGLAQKQITEHTKPQ